MLFVSVLPQQPVCDCVYKLGACERVSVAAAMPAAYKGECGDEVDPMPFLAPPEKERLEAMAKPYDIKRTCWVKDKKEAFVGAEIQSEEGDKVTVKTVKNTVRLTLLFKHTLV